MTKDQYLKENDLRKIEEVYDPKSGLNAYGERKEVQIAEFGTLYLPVSFLKIGWIKKIVRIGSIEKYCEKAGITDYQKVIVLFIKERFIYDCEYWLCTQATIKIKSRPKDDFLIASKTQKEVLYSILDDWYAGNPVRIIVVKCRQAFITTIVSAFNMWVQTCIFKQWNSLICGDVENQSTNVRGIQDKIAKNIPGIFTDNGSKFEILPFEGSNKTRVITQRDCKLSTGSMQKPDNVRAADNSSSHCTEVGLWKTTLGKTPEDLIQAIRGGMDDVAHTVFILESSPKGTGNYFYNQWIEAKTGRSDLKPVFLPWFWVPRYSSEIKNKKEFFDIFLNGENSEYLQYLWTVGATLEQINWYINKLKSMEHWRVQSEFPSNDVEAFQSTGNRVFSMPSVERRRKECVEPCFIGDIHGGASKGHGALENISLEKINDFLKIWCYPDKDEDVSDRYEVVIDIGKGKSLAADSSVITVLDRYGLMFGGRIEVVAEWKGKIDVDLLVWKGAQIATLYNNALLVIEKNTIDTMVDYSGVLLSELNGAYTNLYRKVSVDKLSNITTEVIGFHTNTSTKPLIIENMQGALRDDLYYERNKDACVEMDTYELKENGSFGAADKTHDDMVMTRAIGLYISTKMPLPKVRVEERVFKKKIVGMSSM